jgi:hypothetical protein
MRFNKESGVISTSHVDIKWAPYPSQPLTTRPALPTPIHKKTQDLKNMLEFPILFHIKFHVDVYDIV